MASGRHVQYRLSLQSNASSVLSADSAAANKFDNSMWQVQKTLAAFGLGMGAHYLIDAAKGWTKAAADYEQSMLRIKNASISDKFGLFNESYLNNQVDKFKTKLQESADAYGNFLFKIKNANLSNEVSNRLFENLNVVSKVGAIPQEQMDATIRNVGILLGEGVLEARHLRGLSYVHPQIVPYLAEALGLKGENEKAFSKIMNKDTSDETASQMLSQLISSGKLTKLALNSNLIIEAFEKYRLNIESKLPETLDLVQSKINSLSNTWERFKISITLGQKPELVSFFETLEKDIKWLTEHEDNIVHIASNIATLVKLYLEWKGIMLLVNGANAIYTAFLEGYSGLAASNVSSVTLQTSAYNALALAIERMNIANQQATVYGAAGLSSLGFPLLAAGEGAAIGSSAAAATVTRTAGGLSSAIMPVAIMFMAGQVIDELMPYKDIKGEKINFWNVFAKIDDKINRYNDAKENESKGMINDRPYDNVPHWVNKTVYEQKQKEETEINERILESQKRSQKIFDEVNNIFGKISSSSKIWLDHLKKIGLIYDEISGQLGIIQLRTLSPSENPNKRNEYTGYNFGGEFGLNNDLLKKYLHNEEGKQKLQLKDDKTKLRGNSSNYFTVNIHGGLNGLKDVTFKSVDANTIKNIEDEVSVQITRNLLQVINDIQVVKTGH